MNHERFTQLHFLCILPKKAFKYGQLDSLEKLDLGLVKLKNW